jgi:hypothetical protein
VSNRLWAKADEWVSHAPCGDDIRFIIEPDKLKRADRAHVDKTCRECPVRPECIEASCITRQENSIRVAGVWLPDTYTAASRRELATKRDELVASLPHERAVRPDCLL